MSDFSGSTDDRRSVTIRLGILQVGSAVAFTLIAFSFWYFQVVQHEKYKELAENNHQRTIALRAPRGVLFDRDGRPLVENRSSFTISIVREHTKDIGHTIRVLSEVAGLDPKDVTDIVNKHKREPTYRPIMVVDDASLAQVAAVLARRLESELPDVQVEEVPTRLYPAEAFAAHLFGYVGEASEGQVEADGLGSGAIVGQAGVEKIYNKLLMGEDGARRVKVNSMGREISTLEEIPYHEGRRVQLTIDADLQRAAEEGFKAGGFNGAAVVMDPRTGEVLAFTSRPGYNPNDFAAGIDRATWAGLNTDPLKPLQNRAIQGLYSPGSTFKIVVEVAALEEGIVSPDFRVFCGGSAVFFGRPFQCWKRGGHGSVDMRHALEGSCNVYHYTIGNMVGVDKIHKWATLLGLGEKTGIDLPNEVEGLVPSTEWKRKRYNEKWYAGETISVSIGQGQVSITPISLAVMMSTVANGGTRFVPHLLKAVDEGKGWQPVQAPEPKSQVKLKPETIAALHDGLYLVVNGAGTGGRARIQGRDVSGKTGTAQVISLQGGRKAAGRTERDLRDHGWFVFFAPRDNPEIAGVIFGEHNEHGATSAPIAKHVLETYFNKKDHLPLPKLSMPVPDPSLERDEPPLQEPATPVTDAEPRRSAPRVGGN
ncbi:MAG TPA: penicillin-binding protein 2 [Vicinamibacterales bacterium]|nr:penicillin-binding protein 2 [Vicinamibacterales bacterium]